MTRIFDCTVDVGREFSCPTLAADVTARLLSWATGRTWDCGDDYDTFAEYRLERYAKADRLVANGGRVVAGSATEARVWIGLPRNHEEAVAFWCGK